MNDRELLQQALEALEEIAWSNNTTWQSQRAQIEVDALRERLAQPECWCHKCNDGLLVNGIPYSATRMILCPTCGNKRCPHASNHLLPCTDSNEPGQPGSVYGGLAQPEPVQFKCTVVDDDHPDGVPLSKWGRHPYQEPFCYHDGRNIVGKEFADHSDVFPLYTAPQPRQWQGLTDEERNNLWRNIVGWGDPSHDDEDLMKAIEAKLLEKNT